MGIHFGTDLFFGKSYFVIFIYSLFFQQIIVDFLFELFRIKRCEEFEDWDQAIRDHLDIYKQERDSWKLHEEFIVAEGKILLPHISKYR